MIQLRRFANQFKLYIIVFLTYIVLKQKRLQNLVFNNAYSINCDLQMHQMTNYDDPKPHYAKDMDLNQPGKAMPKV